MHSLIVELPKGVSKLPAVNLTHHPACGFLIEDRPTADRLSVRLSSRPPEEKYRRMLGLDNEHFQAARSHDSEVRVSHEDLSTMIH